MSQPPAVSTGSGCLKWPSIALVLIVLIVSLSALKGCGALRETLADIQKLMGGIVQQDITTSFRESLLKITATKGDILEVATVEMDETFTRMNMKAIANIFYLGTTVSEIRVPAVYRYHIKLSDDWKVTIDGDRCLVNSPIIRPSLPTAIRTDKMEKRSEAGWARFDAAQNMLELEKSITPSLESRAGNASHIDRVRDPARKAVAEFVKTWLLKNPKSQVKQITVIFADEPAAKDAKLVPQAATLDVQS
jgi:hypothetical protein